MKTLIKPLVFLLLALITAYFLFALNGVDLFADSSSNIDKDILFHKWYVAVPLLIVLWVGGIAAIRQWNKYVHKT